MKKNNKILQLPNNYNNFLSNLNFPPRVASDRAVPAQVKPAWLTSARAAYARVAPAQIAPTWAFLDRIAHGRVFPARVAHARV